MKHIYKGSSIKITIPNYEQGGTITFYTVNPSFGTTYNGLNENNEVILVWSDLRNLGRGVLQYKLNNPSTGTDYTRTTDYYIDSDLEVSDTETLGNVSDRIENTVSGKLTEKIDAGIEKVTRSAQEKLGTVDSRLTEIQADLTTKCPYVGGDYYVYNYDRSTGSLKKTSLYVKGQDGRNGIDGRNKEVRHSPTDTTVTINSGEFHVWDEVESLNITLQPASNSPFLDEYGFSFKTGSTAPRISLPSNIKLPRTFIILPNHIYTVTILGTVLEFGSQSL
jgi:hypothetical protein|nr:MAG TPA: hypothetical protein [Caudoviricetes sp.]